MIPKQDMLDKIKASGARKRYKPLWQEGLGDGTILIETRKPATIVDGYLEGSEIDMYDSETYRIWTSQVKKANAVAKANGFRIRLLDSECELFVPANRADEFLPAFGAKTRRTPSPAAIKHLNEIRAKSRINTEVA